MYVHVCIASFGIQNTCTRTLAGVYLGITAGGCYSCLGAKHQENVWAATPT